MTISNSKTRRIKIETIMATKYFMLGISDYLQDKWLEVCEASEAWNYERGRLFAAYCIGQTGFLVQLKKGRKITNEALTYCSEGFRTGDIR